MARLRSREYPESTDLVLPEELKDFRHPVWASEETTRDWYLEHLGSAPAISFYPQRRRAAAETDWAIHHGLVVGFNPPIPDHARMRELGARRLPLTDHEWNEGA